MDDATISKSALDVASTSIERSLSNKNAAELKKSCLNESQEVQKFMEGESGTETEWLNF